MRKQFTAEDGVAISYIRYAPVKDPDGTGLDAGARLPGVLFQPGNRCDAQDYAWIAEAIAGQGYVVYSLDQRGYGCGEPGVNDRGGPIQQADFRQALAILREDKLVDPARIAIGGHSNGCHVSLRTAALDEGPAQGYPPVACIFAMSQVADWARFVNSAKEYYPDYYEQIVAEFGGSPEDNPDPYRDRSNIHLADQIKCPVLNLVGGDDTTCPPHLTRSMHEALLAAGNEHSELCVIEEVGHFYEMYNFGGYKLAETAEAICDFLRRHL